MGIIIILILTIVIILILTIAIMIIGEIILYKNKTLFTSTRRHFQTWAEHDAAESAFKKINNKLILDTNMIEINGELYEII